MATDSPDRCALDGPGSRRFYVHVGSLGFLVAAQPAFFEEVAHALALSGASRALDQAVQDWAMYSPSKGEQSLETAAEIIHDRAGQALQRAFRRVVQLVPERFGATELLLGAHEQINAWCYEDGYLTYATDEDAARAMYAETGSLRRLRSEIRRVPDYDPALTMISGPSLFLLDQGIGTGVDTAVLYKRQSARLLRGFRRTRFPDAFCDPFLADELEDCVSASARTFEGASVLELCLRRGNRMGTTLLRSLSSIPDGAENSGEHA